MTSARKPKIFCISCFHAGYAKKGVCLARMKEKPSYCGGSHPSICPFYFGCHKGELRPGLSGWMHENAEVLELLTFWKPKQQSAWSFRIWRPPLLKISYSSFKQFHILFSININPNCISPSFRMSHLSKYPSIWT